MAPDTARGSRYGAVVARTKQNAFTAAVHELAASLAGKDASHLDRAAPALRLAAAADTYARAEVMAAREVDGASWTDVGAELVEDARRALISRCYATVFSLGAARLWHTRSLSTTTALSRCL